MSAPRHERKPWPMKWVVFAILVVIVPYTWITLHFRKPEKAFEPYQDIKDRANTMRLLSAGFQRITVTAERPAEPKPLASTLVAPAAGGLPADLTSSLVEPPRLPLEIYRAAAPATATVAQPYTIQFTCDVPDNTQQLGGAQFYVRGEEIFIVPTFERLNHGLMARSRESVVLLTVPAGALKPGRFRATLVGSRTSQAWSFQVK